STPRKKSACRASTTTAWTSTPTPTWTKPGGRATRRQPNGACTTSTSPRPATEPTASFSGTPTTMPGKSSPIPKGATPGSSSRAISKAGGISSAASVTSAPTRRRKAREGGVLRAQRTCAESPRAARAARSAARAGMTAHRCLFRDGGIQGQTVLVAGGAGAVGHAAIQLAKWGGARVASTVSRPEQEKLAREAGADLVVNRKTEDAAARIKAFTRG